MKKLLVVLLFTATLSFAQDAVRKPNVVIKKMTDEEYKRLSTAADDMYKEAETYTEAADTYEKTKREILGKYDALESFNNISCYDFSPRLEKLVDVKEEYIIIEYRPVQATVGCSFATDVGTTAIVGTIVGNGSTLSGAAPSFDPPVVKTKEKK